MKKCAVVLSVFAVVILCAAPAAAQKVKACATIQGGTLTDSAGNLLSTGYDQWGYNYQAKMFNGFYDNSSRPSVLATDGDRLEMKWNDAWLSNVDCDRDGKLDRSTPYLGSGAWLTNHQWGQYVGNDGVTYKWDYFLKIIAAPLNGVKKDGNWYTSDGLEIGPEIWGDFVVLQEIYNDPGAGDHGVLYKTPVGPGLGKGK